MYNFFLRMVGLAPKPQTQPPAAGKAHGEYTNHGFPSPSYLERYRSRKWSRAIPTPTGISGKTR